jgi:hypothetical protein
MLLRSLSIGFVLSMMSTACSSSNGGGSIDGGETGSETGSETGVSGLYCEDSTGTCTCTPSTGKTTPGAVCDGTKFPPATICCADATYPKESASACTCMEWGCQDPGGSCTCSIANGGPGALTECPADYTKCCFDTTNGLCTCNRLSSIPCSDGYIEVAKCGLELAACPLALGGKVKSCT